MDLAIQLEYGIVKLRAFLQHAKGLIYDLDLLDIQSGELRTMITGLRERIVNWSIIPFAQDSKSYEHTYHQKRICH